MNESRGFVFTPRVEIGSPQYKADVSFMKLFDSYESYLSYEADLQKPWTSYHPSTTPTVTTLDDLCNSSEETAIKDSTRAFRRNYTAVSHKHPNKKFSHLSKKHGSHSAVYKRARILQPQCVSLVHVSFAVVGQSKEFVDLFGSYEEYLDYLYDCYSSNEPATPDFYLEVSGLRISEQSPKYCTDSQLTTTQKVNHDAHVESLYELRLITSALPGIPVKTAKRLQQLVYSYLDGNGKKSEDESLLDYLLPLARPDLSNGEISSTEKVLSLSSFTAYMEVKRLVELVKFMSFDDSSEDCGESKEDHSNKKLIPTSDFFPKAPDDTRKQDPAQSNTHVDHRHLIISHSAPPRIPLKETPVPIIMEKPQFLCQPSRLFLPAYSRSRTF